MHRDPFCCPWGPPAFALWRTGTKSGSPLPVTPSAVQKEAPPAPGADAKIAATATTVPTAAPVVPADPMASTAPFDDFARWLRDYQSARAQAPTGAWVQGSATTLPFATSGFDVVVCQQGVQFFPDRLAALREMHRVLRPGGRVQVADIVLGRPVSEGSKQDVRRR